MSKALTSAALATLYETGKLDLDGEVQTYAPSFPSKEYPVLVRQVAAHLAGIRSYKRDEFYNMQSYRTVVEGLDIFKDGPLIYEPGTEFLYTSYGWNLLSAVVEGASGQDFLTYIQDAVFDPLGMHSTGADKKAPVIPQRAGFYEVDEDGKTHNAHYVDNSYKWAGGLSFYRWGYGSFW